MVSELLVIGVILFSAFLAAIAQYLFKKGMPRFEASLGGVLSLMGQRTLMIGVAIYVASLFIYLYALHYGELSFVYPTFASVFVFVLLLSRFKLREQISLHRALGVGLVVIGIAIVALTY